MSYMRALLAIAGLTACHHEPDFGKVVAPPSPLDRLRPWMTEAEVVAKVPAAKPDPERGLLVGELGHGARMYALTLRGYVEDLFVHYDGGDLRERLIEAWGPADAEPDRDTGFPVWRSVATKWRAVLNCNAKDSWCEVTFHPHAPLEQMFTADLRPPHELANARWHMPRAELAALTPMPEDSRIRGLPEDGARESVEIRDGVLDEIGYKVPDQAERMMEHAWPNHAQLLPDERIYWKPDANWCVAVWRHGEYLRANYLPFESVDKAIAQLAEISAAPTLAAARALPFTAWTTDELVTLPMTSATMQPTAKTIAGVKETDHGLTVELSIRETAVPVVQAALVKLWGAPTVTSPKDALFASVASWPHHAELQSDNREEFGETRRAVVRFSGR